MIDNLNTFCHSRKEIIIDYFFIGYIEMLPDANYDAKQNETK